MPTPESAPRGRPPKDSLPLSLHGLDPDDVLRAVMRIPPPPKAQPRPKAKRKAKAKRKSR